MGINKRGKVWLAVSGLVIDDQNRWLVVKKKYGGLKGKWSFPAGFVDPGETADEAVIREVVEETGIQTKILGLIGLRTGVIKEEISDNMILFLLEPTSFDVSAQQTELYEAAFIHPEELKIDESSSILIHYLIDTKISKPKPPHNGLNPGDQFGYSVYKVFL